MVASVPDAREEMPPVRRPLRRDLGEASGHKTGRVIAEIAKGKSPCTARQNLFALVHQAVDKPFSATKSWDFGTTGPAFSDAQHAANADPQRQDSHQPICRRHRCLGSRATVLRSKRILVMLQERLEMDEEFAHGSDDGAFVGFAAGDQALDVLANDGVVLRRALGGHVQTASHLGASAADGTFAFPLATVTIPQSQPG